MTDDLTQKDEAALAALFAQVRAEPIAPAPALMERVLADAARAASERFAPRASAAVGGPAGFLSGLWSALGGWSGAGGLAAVTAAGLWLGVAPPQGLESVSGAFFGTSETVAILAEDDLLGSEG